MECLLAMYCAGCFTYNFFKQMVEGRYLLIHHHFTNLENWSLKKINNQDQIDQQVAGLKFKFRRVFVVVVRVLLVYPL